MLCTDGPRRDKMYLLYLQTGMPNLGLKGNRCRHESEYRETRGEGEREREKERKRSPLYRQASFRPIPPTSASDFRYAGRSREKLLAEKLVPRMSIEHAPMGPSLDEVTPTTSR